MAGLMKYADGKEIRLGDQVGLASSDQGIVAASMDSNEYSPEYPGEEWSYLKKGVMVQFSKCGLIHYELAEPDLYLICRGPAPS